MKYTWPDTRDAGIAIATVSAMSALVAYVTLPPIFDWEQQRILSVLAQMDRWVLDPLNIFGLLAVWWHFFIVFIPAVVPLWIVYSVVLEPMLHQMLSFIRSDW